MINNAVIIRITGIIIHLRAVAAPVGLSVRCVFFSSFQRGSGEQLLFDVL